MPYGKRYNNYRKPRATTTRKGPAYKYTKYPKYYKKKTTKKEVTKIVKREIARTVENKLTNSANVNANLIYTDASSNFNYFQWAPQGSGNILSLAQGTGQNQRVGNQVTIKRWVVKGAFPINYDATDTLTLATGIVKLYLVRRHDYQPISSAVPSFYQDGASTQSPNGTLMQRLMPINKDVYKVYWSRTLKLGPSSPGVGSSGELTNNDFSLSPSFGFDVCKYICKNKVVKYDDGSVTPTDTLLNSLTLVAIWTNSNGDITVVPSKQSWFNLAVNSYIEYEDA